MGRYATRLERGYLHARSQDDLLKHLQNDYGNQIIYSTHSPFMVPADAIRIVRTVNISQDHGTQVTNSPTGDARTLFPLQAALGYSLSQTLFVGKRSMSGTRNTLPPSQLCCCPWRGSRMRPRVQAFGRKRLSTNSLSTRRIFCSARLRRNTSRPSALFGQSVGMQPNKTSAPRCGECTVRRNRRGRKFGSASQQAAIKRLLIDGNPVYDEPPY
jgi:hypothetical protein